MNILRDLRTYLRIATSPVEDGRVLDAINMRNTKSVATFALLACVFDLVNLLILLAVHRASVESLRTYGNVSFCVLACAVAYYVADRLLRRHEAEGAIEGWKANLLLVCFYVMMCVWSASVDVMHYAAGEQMLTFYTVQFCFMCFASFSPRMGSLLVALTFAALQLATYVVDGGAIIQPLNHAFFAACAIAGLIIKRASLIENEASRLEIEELNQVLMQEASVDFLTCLKNRKALRSDFEGFLGSPRYVVMADVDKFKRYNDTYGHPKGDIVLREVASAIKEAFPHAEAYRYGGDEFMIVAPDCPAADFEAQLARWDELTAAISIPDVPVAIACSHGHTHCTPLNVGDLRAAIKLADERLYEVKRSRANG